MLADDRISADSISRIAIREVWSEHSLNPIESAVSEIDLSFTSQFLGVLNSARVWECFNGNSLLIFNVDASGHALHGMN